MTEQSQAMTIGKLADALDINIETIRYQQREGLVKQPAKRNNGFRYYGLEQSSLKKLRSACTISEEEMKNFSKMDCFINDCKC